MNDPKDKYFYQLHKKDKSQLSLDELNDYQNYCHKMIAYVSDKKARKEWNNLLKEIETITCTKESSKHISLSQ